MFPAVLDQEGHDFAVDHFDIGGGPFLAGQENGAVQTEHVEGRIRSASQGVDFPRLGGDFSG